MEGSTLTLTLSHGERELAPYLGAFPTERERERERERESHFSA
jgi:hypothetical protein